MLHKVGNRLDVPTRKRAAVFVLMPFADAMFQLLVFFMVASNVTPYSIVTISSGPAGLVASEQIADRLEPITFDTRRLAEWTVGAGFIALPGPQDQIPFSDLGALIDRLEQARVQRIVLSAGLDARVQDVVHVMELVMESDIRVTQFQQADLR